MTHSLACAPLRRSVARRRVDAAIASSSSTSSSPPSSLAATPTSRICAVASAPRRACAHCDQGLSHPQFACLLSSTPPVTSPGVHTSSWDSDRQPMWQLRCHNRDRRFVRGAKATKLGAPHHVHALVIGPFTCNAKSFERVMKANNRKFKNRLVRGVRLAQLWHLIDAEQGRETPLRIWCADDAARAHITHLLRETAHDDHATHQMTCLTAAATRELALVQRTPLTAVTTNNDDNDDDDDDDNDGDNDNDDNDSK